MEIISAGRTGLLSIMLVAFREVMMLFVLLPPAWMTGARLKVDMAPAVCLCLVRGYRGSTRCKES